MRILYVAHRVPFPPNKGDKIRSFQEIKYLSARHEVHLLAFFDQADDRKHQQSLRRFCKSVTLIPLKVARQRIPAILSMLCRRPWTVGFYRRRVMADAVWRTFARERIDIVFGYSSSMAQYIDALPAPKLIDLVDSDAAKWRQYSEMISFPARQLYAYESRSLAQLETRIVETFDGSIFVGPREVNEYCDPGVPGGGVRRPVEMQRIHFMPNGVDLTYFKTRVLEPATPTVIFTGAMDYFPNCDAVIFFCRTVWPLVIDKVPEARFLIVGSRPVAAIRRLHGHHGVIVTGTVPDVRPYLDSASVAVVPLRISRGIQNKALEALAAGRPVVMTQQAAAGLKAIADLPVTVASEPRAFADGVIAWLCAPEQSERRAAETREVLNRHYNWETNLSKLDELLAPHQTPMLV